MVMDLAAKPRDTFILNRGDYAQPTIKVSAGTIEALPPMPKDAKPDRSGLAAWITMKNNPLTARVAVNRFWKMLFGTGIVATPADFGAQGEWPSHPDVLDWLAVEFIESGWDVKHLLKLIVMSDTYRQSSAATSALLERDPQNRCWRGGRGSVFRPSCSGTRRSKLAVACASHWRAERQPLHARRSVARSQPLRQHARNSTDFCPGPWRKTLPSQSLHLLEANRRAAQHDRV